MTDEAVRPPSPKKKRPKSPVKLPRWGQLALQAQQLIFKPVVLVVAVAVPAVINLVLGLPGAAMIWMVGVCWALALGSLTLHQARALQKRGQWETRVDQWSKTTSLGQMLVRHYRKRPNAR